MHTLPAVSYQCDCPGQSTNFRSIFNNAWKYCTKAPPSSSPSSLPAESIDVEGKSALVMDGTSGVGFMFANELLTMNAAKVVITGLDERTGAEASSELKERYGPARVEFYRTDVTYPSEIEKLFNYTRNNGQALDIFFNNAEMLHEDVIATNLVSKIHGIVLACKNMKPGGVIVNHTSALAFDPNPDMIDHSAASAGFLVASMAFTKNKYFKDTKIKMTTLCSELLSPMSVGSTTAPFACSCNGQEAADIQLSIAKSAAYVVRCGSGNTLWLCQRNGILSTVELQTLDEFTENYHPNFNS